MLILRVSSIWLPTGDSSRSPAASAQDDAHSRQSYDPGAHGGSFRSSAQRFHSARVLARSFVLVSNPLPARTSSPNRRTSRLDPRSHSDKNRLRETHSVVVGQSNPPTGGV